MTSASRYPVYDRLIHIFRVLGRHDFVEALRSQAEALQNAFGDEGMSGFEVHLARCWAEAGLSPARPLIGH